MAPCLGDISVINTAVPIANGVATNAAINVTKNDPVIIGKAPVKGCPCAFVWPGAHFLPDKKSQRLTLLVKNVAKPFEATNKKIEITTTTINNSAEKVITRPNRSFLVAFDFFNNDSRIESMA